MNEVFRSILTRADVQDGNLFAAYEVARWPEGAIDWLTRAGILRAAQPAEEILCEECPEGCWIKPIIRKNPETRQRFGTYFCRRNEDVGSFKVDLARRRQWEFNLAGLAGVVAKAVGAKGKPAEVEPGRLVLLGTAKLDGKARELFLARGIAWKDASIFAAPGRLRAALHPALLTLTVMAAPDLLPGRELAARPLAEIASLDGKGLHVSLDGAFPTTEPGPWADLPNEPIMLDKFMAKFCDKRRETLVVARRKALLAADRNKSVKLPDHVEPWTSGQAKTYFTHDLLDAWQGYVDRSLVPPLLPQYERD